MLSEQVDAASGAVRPKFALNRILLTAARVLFGAAIVAAVAYATRKNWSDFIAYWDELRWGSALASLVLVLAGMCSATMGFRAALRSTGHGIGVRTASQIYLIGLLAKYLPGSIWALVLQAELGKRANLPRSRAFAASVILTGLSTTVTLVFGLFAVPALLSPQTQVAVGEAGASVNASLAIAVLALLPVALVFSIPAVLTRVINLGLRLLRRPALDRAFTWPEVGAIVGWSAITLVCFGAHLWVLAQSADDGPGIASCVAAISLGMTLGLLAFLAPSGLGAREAAIVAVIAPTTSIGTALGMALVSRMIFTAADLISAGAAALSGISVFGAKPGLAVAGESVQAPAGKR